MNKLRIEMTKVVDGQQVTGFEDVEVFYKELSAGVVMDCMAEEDKTVFRLAAAMIIDSKGLPIFADHEDVSKRLSSKSTNSLAECVFNEVGLGDSSVKDTKKK